MVFETKYIRITVLIFFIILYVTVILISNKQKIIKILGYSIMESLSLYVEVRNLVRPTETYAKGTVAMYT